MRCGKLQDAGKHCHANGKGTREAAETLTKAMATAQPEPNSSAACIKRHCSGELGGYSSVREPRRPNLMKMTV